MSDMTPHCYLRRVEENTGSYYKESVWIEVPENKGIGTANISTVDRGEHKFLQIELPIIEDPGSENRIVQRNFEFDPEPGLLAVLTLVNEEGYHKGKTVIDLDDADTDI